MFRDHGRPTKPLVQPSCVANSQPEPAGDSTLVQAMKQHPRQNLLTEARGQAQVVDRRVIAAFRRQLVSAAEKKPGRSLALFRRELSSLRRAVAGRAALTAW